MLNQVGGSKTEVAIKALLVFLISFFSFSVGTYVGKQVSDSEYRNANLEDNGDGTSARQAASLPEEAVEVEPQAQLSDEEIASLSEEFMAAEKSKLKKEQNADSEEPIKDSTLDQMKPSLGADSSQSMGALDAGLDEKAGKVSTTKRPKMQGADGSAMADKAALRVAKNMAPSPDPKRVRRPTSVLPKMAAGVVGKYTVQVAAYLTEQEAYAHASRLKTQGFNAFFIGAKIKNETWYRVSVGVFANRKSAMKFQTELKEQARVASSIIRKIDR